jgi:hypothetical protein
MTLTKEELQGRIRRYTAETKRVNAVVVAATMLLLVLCVAVMVGLARRGSLPSNRLVVLLPAAAISVVAGSWLMRRIKQLQRKHGLLCESCGLLVTKTGFKSVLNTGKCERCDAVVFERNVPHAS